MKKLVSLMLAAAMVFTLAACAGKSEDKAAFRFGASGPLTGDAAIYGKAVMNGAQIAVDEINAKGGVQIVFNAQDDEADGEKAVNAYNTLMDWGMQVLVGPVTTGSAIAVSAKAFEERTFCLTPSASSTDVTAGKDNMYQLCFTDPNQGIGSADYISRNLAGHKIAVIYRNDDAYSQGIRDTFIAEAQVVGLDIVYEGTFTKDTQTDFSVQLGKAQSEGADLLYLPIYYQPASVILAQAKSMNYSPIFFGVDGMDGILTMEGFDTSLAEGVMLLTPFAADAQDSLTKSFVEEYQKRFKEVPNQFAADGYDTVYVLYNALIASGCTPDMSAPDICARLIAQIQSITHDGLTGSNMSWTANGEVSKMPVAVVIKNGAYVSA
ncbi:MAG: amino acid ABC transporter substrate-binding protein [Ruminococcaceae bacterium]|jgi:branched-chain amino acid transport system substrate-binding protein|nr:amino acid ABC transporter substrate-binding protein [Oscillospiraceae bacterium]